VPHAEVAHPQLAHKVETLDTTKHVETHATEVIYGEPKNFFYDFPEPPRVDSHHENELEASAEEEVSEEHLSNNNEEPVPDDHVSLHDDEEVPDEHRSAQDVEKLRHLVQDELSRRHLGHKLIRRPVWQKASLSDIKDLDLHSTSFSQIVETMYDDHSSDRQLLTTDVDHVVETTIGFLPSEDGILKTFIDRYTTMLVHDSIYMEEVPAPHARAFAVFESPHHPHLTHDPWEAHWDDFGQHVNEDAGEDFFGDYLYDIQHENEEPPHHDTKSSHPNANYIDAEDVREGAHHLYELLGMHLKGDLEHPVTKYGPEHGGRDYSEHYDDDGWFDRQEEEGFYAHDRHGDRRIEHAPFHRDFVQESSHRLHQDRPSPIMEHNPHAFPAPHETSLHGSEAKPQAKAQAPKAPEKAATTPKSPEKAATTPKAPEKTASAPKAPEKTATDPKAPEKTAKKA